MAQIIWFVSAMFFDTTSASQISFGCCVSNFMQIGTAVQEMMMFLAKIISSKSNMVAFPHYVTHRYLWQVVVPSDFSKSFFLLVKQVPALRSPPVRPVSVCSSMLFGGILVLNAVCILSTNVLQCELSTQILSPRESSMYT